MAKAPAPKSRLGRGLSSLLNVEAGERRRSRIGRSSHAEVPGDKPEPADTDPGPHGLRDLPVEAIVPNAHQPRRSSIRASWSLSRRAYG